jgi:DNA polymerase (family X)
MNNQQVAILLHTIADLLDLRAEMPFKVRAYRMAAQTIETLDEDITSIVHENRLRDIPGIGEALAKKITEYVQTGKLTYLEDLKKETPEGLIELMRIPGLGPRKVAAIHKSLGIHNIQDLKTAATQGKLRDLKGFGETTERNILRGIELREKTSGRVLLAKAYTDGTAVLDYMKTCPDIINISLAGSLRRMKDTIGDIDILVSSKHPAAIMDYFTRYPLLDTILAKGETKTSILLTDGLQMDLRVVEDKSYGAALQYFTGSKDHNVTLRGLAIKKSYKLNEYGLFTKDTDRYITGHTETDVYHKIGLDYIPPELRENRGEIEAAQTHTLPTLVTQDQIQGDFHVHSTYSDGHDTIDTIAHAAQQLGYHFIGITDHSQSLKIANGLTEERIHKKIDEINTLNKHYPDLTILCGTECDIKPDGSLDYPNHILQQLDYVYIAIHTTFKMTIDAMTDRIITAMHNDNADILAHPTQRLIGQREPIPVDLDKVIDAAKDTKTLLEINAFPDRLDLDDLHVKQAKEHGVTLAIGTDSHNVLQLTNMRYGVSTARRGWLEASDLLNTKPPKEITRFLQGRKQ